MSDNCIAIINKPSGISSSDVVIKCRNAFSHSIGKKIKCGHMGTLDPMASGILIVAFGNATRLFDFALKKEKSYIATFTFGEERDTIDATGKIIKTCELPKFQHIADILPNFIGKIIQVPPKYSAVNINGRRAYDLARKGREFEIQAKEVFVKDIKILDKTLDGELCKEITLSINCGSGTYIRSLCRDIANGVESVAYMSKLVRNECAGFELGDQYVADFANFLANPLSYIQDTTLLVDRIMPSINLDEKEYFKIRNGQSICINEKNGLYSAIYMDNLVFIINVEEGKAKSVCYLGD